MSRPLRWMLAGIVPAALLGVVLSCSGGGGDGDGVTCDPGFHLCGTGCLPDNSADSCGTLCTPCPAAPEHAVGTCVAGNCGFACQAGYVACNAACCPQLLVRTASGDKKDMTGTAWVTCVPGEPGSGASRLTTMSFGAGTFTLASSFFATEDCTGAPVSTEPSVTAPIVAQGDHVAGWGTEGPAEPPPGLPTTVTATAVIISGAPASPLPPDLKTLLFVNDGASPDELHFGGKTAGADGYPTTLEPTGRTLVP